MSERLDDTPTDDTRRGQGLVEYALILLVIAMVVLGIITLLGGQVSGMYSDITSAVPTS